jgi:hypothetical protein
MAVDQIYCHGFALFNVASTLGSHNDNIASKNDGIPNSSPGTAPTSLVTSYCEEISNNL